MTAEQHLRAAEFTARHWHQTALGSGHTPFAHAIACISAAIAGETDPNQLGLDPSVHDAFRAALGEPDDLIRERCPHCPETLPRNRVDDHVTTAHADLSPCTASIHVRTNDTTYRCAFRVGHNGEYGALHASAYAKRGGRYVWDDEHDGVIPHREAETDANGWTLKDDGIWTLPVDGGTVLMTRQTTPEERARFAEQWARDTKTKPGDDWAQKDDGTWKLTVKVGHHHSAAFRADESSTPWYRAQFARIAKAVSPILEEWPEHNRIDEHEHVTRAITEAVLAAQGGERGVRLAAENPSLYDTLIAMFGGPLPPPDDTPPVIILKCSLAHLRQPHSPHRWQPQPGMRHMQCPGWEHNLAEVIQAAQQQYKAEQGEETSALEALGYHAMGQGIHLERAEAERKQAEERRDQLAVTLDEVLRHFVHPGHPGEPCLQTGWISVKTVDRWRAVLNPPKGGSK